MIQQNIRSEKWFIVASSQQKELLSLTVCEFRCLVRCLVGVVYTHWSNIGLLDAKAQIPAVEKLIHTTTKNPSPKYQYFNQRFYKFPSYYRRGAIQFAIGQVSSFVTRYREWQSGIRSRLCALPPRLNADCGTYPPLYIYNRKANNINREIGQKVSSCLVKIARQYEVKYIVFEHLKGWRPRGGKKGSTLKQRFHNWLHRRIVNLTEMKWSELGGKVVFVNPRGTSSYAYDGSGKLKRNQNNYELAVFSTGKQYNCDLSASYNIGARFIHRLMSRNGSQDLQGKSFCKSPRSRVTLSMLWLQPIAIVEQDTTSSR